MNEHNDDFDEDFDEDTPSSSGPIHEVEYWLHQSRLARKRGDLKYALYADHWVLQALIFRVKDLNRAYGLAVQAALDARKPLHQDQMERVCVHEDLIFTYIGRDPIGYGDLIENAIQYMKQESNPSMQCYYCLFEIQAAFHLSGSDLEQANKAVHAYFSETQQNSHHHSLSHTKVCELMHRYKAWDRLLYFGLRGEQQLGMDSSKGEYIAIVLAAQALALRKLGRESEALTAYFKAVGKGGSVQGAVHHSYYNFLCDFHTTMGNLVEAISLRKRQLKDMTGKGQTYWEAQARLQLLSLLRQKGDAYQEEVKLIQDLAANLRKPEVILSPLNELLAI